AEVSHRAALPEKRVRRGVASQVRKPDHLTSIINGKPPIVHHSPKAAELDHRTVLPEHGVNGVCEGGKTANARPADHLTLVIDPDGSSYRVSGERRKFMDLTFLRPPDDSLPIQDLGRGTVWISSVILRVPDHLTAIVAAAQGDTVIAPQRGQRSHRTVLPKE